MKATPKSTARNGLSSPEITRIKDSLWDRGAIADFMMVMPTKSIPKPMITSPTYFTVLFLTNRNATTPKNIITGAYAARLKAVICAVTVVPMLAPMITPSAWNNVIIPELTKPITMMSVADELCTRMVITIPTNTAVILLDVAFSRIA